MIAPHLIVYRVERSADITVSRTHPTLAMDDHHDFQWYSCPVAIRFNGDVPVGLSGARLTLSHPETAVVACDYIVSISHVDDTAYDGCVVTSTRQYGTSAVEWFPASVVARVPLTDDVRLKGFLDFFRQHGFYLNPSQTVSESDDELKVVVIKTKSPRLMLNLTGNATPKPIRFAMDAHVGDGISIRSFPFNFTNAVLFGDFLSKGHLSFVVGSRSVSTGKPRFPVGYLTDVKYLENMSGALVSATGNPELSHGLVMGQLCKANGDGDLLWVVSWPTIWRVLSRLQGQLHLPRNFPTEKSTIPPLPYPRSVFALMVTDGATRWGSCVLWQEGVLVTNQHVIKDYALNRRIEAKVALIPSHQFIRLDDDDEIITPDPELDLSFIILSPRNRAIVAPWTPITTSTTETTRGQPVYSLSFGLVYSTHQTAPLVSQGIVNTVYTIDDIDAMMVTSARCWNGSSGGGLFSADHEFIGLISSNAEVRAPVWVGQPAHERLHKLPELSIALPVGLIEYCWRHRVQPRVPSSVHRLWQLLPSHQDVVVASPKL
ncbi:hypothetical protein DIRU0_E19790 [Diutina rugosa]